jgi:hypothetical protein
MPIYIRESQESNGDLVDVHYFCSRGCWADSFDASRMGPATAPEGGHQAWIETVPGLFAGIAESCSECVYDDRGIGQACARHMQGADHSGLTEGGAHDCDADYDVYCAECAVLLNGDDAPTVVNLITRPPISPVTGEAEVSA